MLAGFIHIGVGLTAVNSAIYLGEERDASPKLMQKNLEVIWSQSRPGGHKVNHCQSQFLGQAS